MNVFDLSQKVREAYDAYARGNIEPDAGDIKARIQHELDTGTEFFQPPLIQMNARYERNQTIAKAASSGLVMPATAKAFQIKGNPIHLFTHQVEAIGFAKERKPYVVTTGTGSGKSLTYFIPIVDYVHSVLAQGGEPGLCAIVVYPMNALANSQVEELRKFLDGTDIRFERYTGQEDIPTRKRIVENPPHILLTNYMMLELILAGHEEVDAHMKERFGSVKFLALDELHTYRGRQGADVAMLCRRLAHHLADDAICVGTSATIVDNETANKKEAVAKAASKIFGQTVDQSNVVFETLVRVTNPTKLRNDVKGELSARIAKGFDDLTAESIVDDPLAIWVEMTMGMKHDENHVLIREVPRDLKAAAQLLAEDAGIDHKAAEDALRGFLLAATKVNGVDGRSLIGFKLHLFFSGSGRLFLTLDAEGERTIAFKDQVYVAHGEDKARLFEARFCRGCGVEYFPVVRKKQEDGREFAPRPIGNRDIDEDDLEDFDAADGQLGFLMPWREGTTYNVLTSDHTPGNWFETEGKLAKTYRGREPQQIRVNWRAEVSSDGPEYLWIPRNACFCPRCGQDRGTARAEASELPSLAEGGRSTASTLLTLACLDEMRQMGVDQNLHKVLGFTDNRQDASLQAGHFTDFVQALYIRGALLRAANEAPVRLEDLGRKLAEGVAMDSYRFAVEEWHLGGEKDPMPTHPILHAIDRLNELDDDTLKLKEKLLLHTTLVDFTATWRYNFPNLEQLGLVEFDYPGLDEVVTTDRYWQGHKLLEDATPDIRREVCVGLLDFLRRKLCIEHDVLSKDEKERMWGKLSAKFSGSLMPDYTFQKFDDRLFASLDPKGALSRKLESRHVGLSKMSAFGAFLKQPDLWGKSADSVRAELSDKDHWNACVSTILQAMRMKGLISLTQVDGPQASDPKVSVYRLNGSKILIKRRTSEDRLKRVLALKPVSNPFLRKLYQTVAELPPETVLDSVPTAAEHTAQVSSKEREARERAFANAQISALFCSPTMELGVDISELDVVLLRNVPPTPANYAQRSGRAGRQGSPALVITYCSAGSPHDQVYYTKPEQMVQGVVRPPLIDLTNETLQQSHVHALWLGEAEVCLNPAISEIVNIDSETPTDPKSLVLRDNIKAAIEDPALPGKTTAPVGAFKANLKASGVDETKLEQIVSMSINGAPGQFDKAFDRWRGLITAAASQLQVYNRRAQDFSLTQGERDQAKRQAAQSLKQIEMLRDAKSQSTEFYSYRYLASEGFLPGYNFPRLPIRAMLDREDQKTGTREPDTLSRPRFLGITEFGPSAVIYHEGQRYLVKGVFHRVNPDNVGVINGALPTTPLRICEHCGYAHKNAPKSQECCKHCGGVMREAAGDDNPWSRMLEVNQVTTQPVTRITADEEERSRLGYITKTSIEFSPLQGDVNKRLVSADGHDLLVMTYAASANLYRMLLGWRAGGSARGFAMEVATGRWLNQRNHNEAEDGCYQMVIPFVTETKNALLLQLLPQLDETSFKTFQYAFKRAIEVIYQIESSELAVDILDGHDPESDRREILLYEASEGGAGVLVKLMEQPERLSEVAREALRICHYVPEADEDWTKKLQDEKADDCVAGCYTCLLSYFNQPAHELINRYDGPFLGLMQSLAGDLTVSDLKAAPAAVGSLGAWMTAQGFKAPSGTKVVGDTEFTVYAESNVAIAVDPADIDKKDCEESMGFEVVVLPVDEAARLKVLESYFDLRADA